MESMPIVNLVYWITKDPSESKKANAEKTLNSIGWHREGQSPMWSRRDDGPPTAFRAEVEEALKDRKIGGIGFHIFRLVAEDQPFVLIS